MRKVLITTFNRARNYGALLQSFALQEYIKKQSIAVKHLDRMKTEGSFSIKLFLKNILEYRANKRFKSFQNQYITYTTRKYSYNELYALNKEYTHFISGSDQVWNCKHGMVPEFFLSFVSGNNVRISYAASIGLSNIPEEYKVDFINAVDKFSYISCREKTSAEIVQNLIGRQVEFVLDPVFLLSSREWEGIMKKPKIKNYIFVYGFDISEKMKTYILELKRITGLPIVSVFNISGLKVDKILYQNIGPVEFLGYIYGASYVVSSSFHCVAFSLIFEKRLLVFHHKITGVRTRDLLELVSYPKLVSLEQLNEWVKSDFCYDSVREKLAIYISSSKTYIKEALE